MRAYRFRLPLKRALSLRGVSQRDREGILVEQDGAWAEASPLPGFSRDSTNDVISALRGERTESAALAFARLALSQPWKACRVPVNALLQGNHETVMRQCRRLAASAVSAVKLKVGTGDVAVDIERVREVSRILRSDQALRLDANRAWSVEVARTFARGIRDCRVQYIEEPLRDPMELEDFYGQTGLPYALDETLLDHSDLAAFPHAAVLVCKPTLLGDRLVSLMQTKRPLTWSAAYESGVGIARIAQLAAAWSPDRPAGLDTYAWLANDVLKSGLSVAGGQAHVAAEVVLNTDLLEPIEL